MKKTLTQQARKELEFVRKKGRGILRPKRVVGYAENPKTALHGYFEWDDAKAGYEFRVEQARRLIRAVVYLHPVNNKPLRVYASFADERRQGDSYRAMDDILAEETLYNRLVDQALAEAESWRTRYQHIAELAPIVEAISSVGDKRRKPKPKKKPKKRKPRDD